MIKKRTSAETGGRRLPAAGAGRSLAPEPWGSRVGYALQIVANIFLFQAEAGIRDHCVTGVQTCALPICAGRGPFERLLLSARASSGGTTSSGSCGPSFPA